MSRFCACVWFVFMCLDLLLNVFSVVSWEAISGMLRAGDLTAM